MANPKVRPLLHFYPEDCGTRVAEARQASRWLREVDDDLLTPMIRLGVQDFYIFEPTLTTDSLVVMPHRFFFRDGEMFVRIWAMEGVGMGWVVHEEWDTELPASKLLVCFPDYVKTHRIRNLADPRNIIGKSWLS